MIRRTKIAETKRSIQIDGREVVYVLRRTNRRRTIGLIVNHEGLKVASPWYVSMADIYAMIERSKDWVFDKLDAWQVRQMPARHWVSGEILYFFGNEIRLQIDVSLVEHGVFLSGDLLRVFTANTIEVERMVVAWYRTQAVNHFPQRIDAIAPVLEVKPTRCSLSNAKHQWGSCNSKGEIKLNWRLMQAAPVVIDYVVAHELAHLKHMDHSPRFWETVAIACPQYRSLRNVLKENDILYRTL